MTPTHGDGKRARARTLGLVLLVLFFPFLTFTSFFASRSRADEQGDTRGSALLAAIALYDQQRAQVEAAGFCRELGCGRAIEVSVEEDSSFAKTIAAHTTRGAAEVGCVVHVRKSQVVYDRVIAHEACHCKMDYEVLGLYGYLPEVGLEERTRREEAVRRCEKKLTGRRVDP